MEVAGVAEAHHLHSAGFELAVVPKGVGVFEVAFDNVGERLDISVGMHRPFRTGDDPVVVEHAQGSDTHLLRIAIAVDGEVPSGVEPAAVLPIDLAVLPHCQHDELPRGATWLRPQPSRRYAGRWSRESPAGAHRR